MFSEAQASEPDHLHPVISAAEKRGQFRQPDEKDARDVFLQSQDWAVQVCLLLSLA